jgi:hypothetical protein
MFGLVIDEFTGLEEGGGDCCPVGVSGAVEGRDGVLVYWAGEVGNLTENELINLEADFSWELGEERALDLGVGG